MSKDPCIHPWVIHPSSFILVGAARGSFVFLGAVQGFICLTKRSGCASSRLTGPVCFSKACGAARPFRLAASQLPDDFLVKPGSPQAWILQKTRAGCAATAWLAVGPCREDFQRAKKKHPSMTCIVPQSCRTSASE